MRRNSSSPCVNTVSVSRRLDGEKRSRRLLRINGLFRNAEQAVFILDDYDLIYTLCCALSDASLYAAT